MRTAARSFRSLATFTLMAALCLSSLVAFSPGCTTEDEVRATRAQAVQEKAQLDESSAALTTQRDAAQADVAKQEAALHETAVAVAKLPDGPAKVQAEAEVQAAADSIAATKKQIAGVTATIVAAQATSQKLGERIAAGDALLATANQQSATVQLVSSIAGGFNPIAGLLTALVGGLGVKNLQLSRSRDAYKGKANRLADGASNIVRSVDVLAGIAPDVAKAIQVNKEAMRLIQNGTGAKIVELVKGNAKVSSEAVVAAA